MTRLQKKCIFVTVGLHLLLLGVLLFGPAFFNQAPKTDDLTVLDVIPANLIDAAFTSGVKGAVPPAPQPVAVPQPQPVQPEPRSVQPAPTPTLVQRVENYFTPAPKPEPTRPTTEAEDQPHKIQISTQLVARPTPTHPQDNSRNNAAAISSALKNLQKNLAPGTTVNLPGNSSAAYANYASVVKSVYDAAWVLPGSVNSDENIKVSVTIARDGTVISSRIVTPSGDAAADDSVQRALDRVQFVAAFPEDSKDNQRTFVIVFNPQVKSSE